MRGLLVLAAGLALLLAGASFACSHTVPPPMVPDPPEPIVEPEGGLPPPGAPAPTATATPEPAK